MAPKSTRSATKVPRSTSLLKAITRPFPIYSNTMADGGPAKFADRADVCSIMTTRLSPTEIYNERRVFLIGSTGFLGKVTLSMLLHRFPNLGRVYVTVRARSPEESETRFWDNVITAPPFDPLRERYGNAFAGFIRDKVSVVGGDIGETNLVYTEEDAQKLADDLDIVINTA